MAGFCKDKVGEYLRQLEPRSWWLGKRGREGQREREIDRDRKRRETEMGRGQR